MACPLYKGSTAENPLRVCGSKDRMGYAPCAAHIKLYCLTVSAYTQCPSYKLKTSNWSETNRWFCFFRQLFGVFLKKKGEKDGMSRL